MAVAINLNPLVEMELLDQVRYCWRNWSQGKTLLIYDDVQDYKTVMSYLPPSGANFQVLLTSRVKPGANIKQRLELDVLSPDAALALLRSLAGEERIDAELEKAQTLCEWLGYLPLALELVGRYLDIHSTLSIVKLIERLEQQKLAAKALIGAEEADMTAKLGVAAAFELSWQELIAKAQNLGCFLSLFAVAPIHWSLVEAFMIDTNDEDEWKNLQEELENLRDFYLVNSYLLKAIDKNQYILHPLIQEFFGLKIEILFNSNDYKQIFCKKMVLLAQGLLKCSPQKEIEIKVRNTTTPHFIKVIKSFNKYINKRELPWLHLAISNFYELHADYKESQFWAEEGLNEAQEHLEPKHPIKINFINNLALIYKLQGNYFGVEMLYKQALELSQFLYSKNSINYGVCLHNLAQLYLSIGNYKKSEIYSYEAEAIIKNSWGENNQYYVSVINGLAQIKMEQGDYKKVEEYYSVIETITKKFFGENSLAYASFINNLAGLYLIQKKYNKAEMYFKQAKEIRQAIVGELNPLYAESLNNLAGVYYRQSKIDEAEVYYLEALSIKEKTLGEYHPSYVISLNNMAEIYVEKNNYKKAKILFYKALEKGEKAYGKNHPNYAELLNNLAIFNSKQGEIDKAVEMLKEALKIQKKALGVNHPSYVISLQNLAWLCSKSGIK